MFCHYPQCYHHLFNNIFFIIFYVQKVQKLASLRQNYFKLEIDKVYKTQIKVTDGHLTNFPNCWIIFKLRFDRDGMS